ncbi:MAG: hypothetical protein V1777_00405 [Candidatus Micrarchaeota archaeon]
MTYEKNIFILAIVILAGLILFSVQTASQNPQPGIQNQWLEYKPIQCGQNPWEVWEAASGRVYFRAPTEKEILTNYLQTVQGVTILDYKTIPAPDGYATCKACSCQRGDTIQIQTSFADSVKLQNTGWTLVQN